MDGEHLIVSSSPADSSTLQPPHAASQAPALFSSSQNFSHDEEAISDCELDEEALLERRRKDSIRINRLRKNRNYTPPPQTNTTKEFTRVYYDILQSLQEATSSCSVRGFVYGIISDTGKAVTASSENLRKWWKEEVRFDQLGLAAAENYDAELSASIEKDDPEINVYETLMKIHDPILGSLLSALLQHCTPPQRNFPLERGQAPPWWPTGREDWWGGFGLPGCVPPPPYRKPHDLKKGFKAVVLVAVVRHLSGNFDTIRNRVQLSRCLQERMTAHESGLWSKVLRQMERKYRKDQEAVDVPINADIVEIPVEAAAALEEGGGNNVGPTGKRPREISTHSNSAPVLTQTSHEGNYGFANGNIDIPGNDSRRRRVGEQNTDQYDVDVIGQSAVDYGNMPTEEEETNFANQVDHDLIPQLEADGFFSFSAMTYGDPREGYVGSIFGF